MGEENPILDDDEVEVKEETDKRRSNVLERGRHAFKVIDIDLSHISNSGNRCAKLTLDFDGVIHSYTSGWKGETQIPDPPVSLTKKAIDMLRSDYEVVIHSSRCKTPEGIEAVKRWLKKYNMFYQLLFYDNS